MSYEFLPHTADLRARLRGETLPSLYQAGADLVRDILVGGSPVEAREERSFPLEGESDAERFFRFVRELAFLFDAEQFLPATVTLEGEANVVGETFDPQRHTSERQLKAVTRHGYTFEHDAAGYRAELVFDL